MVTGAHLFEMPKLGESYISQIVDRCCDLIDTRIWDGLDKVRIHAWMKNFTSPEERYFGAVVLDALIYRSPEQTKALLVQLFQRILPECSRVSPPPAGAIHDWLTPLRNWTQDPGIRLVPVIRDVDPPTKSGPLVMRLLKRHLRLDERWMIWPWNVSGMVRRGIPAFVFVDDFLGTGYQFSKFIRLMKLEQHLSKARFIYAPLVAHERGLSYLRKRYPHIQFASVETLTKNHSLFSETADFFKDGSNSHGSALTFYRSTLSAKWLPGRSVRELGYGNLGIVYAFGHATPNSSLPILWMRAGSWQPLFDR